VGGDEQSVTNLGKLLHGRCPTTTKGLQAMNDVLLAPQEWLYIVIVV